MMAPPPASSLSQNQALCGPGVRLARAHPQHVAQRARLDRGQRLERLGRVDQILQVAGKDAGLLHDLQHLLGLGGVARQRLGAEDRLARLRGQRHGLLVLMVGQADDDGVGVRVVDGRGHVVGGAGDAPLLGEGLRARFADANRPTARGRGRAGRAASSCRTCR